MLSTDANRSPAVATPMMINTTSAMTKPRLRPTELFIIRANDDSRLAVPSAAASTR